MSYLKEIIKNNLRALGYFVDNLDELDKIIEELIDSGYGNQDIGEINNEEAVKDLLEAMKSFDKE